MTLIGDEWFRYTRYSYEEVFSLLISRSRRTRVAVVHAAPHQGRRITIRYQRDGHDEERVAVVLGRSSDWYKYRLNVFAEFEGIQWVVAGTHDSCLGVPVWSVEEEKLYEPYQTSVPFSELLTNPRFRHTEFGHKLLFGGMMCGLSEARQVAAKALKRSALFQMERDVRRSTHRRRGRQLRISESPATA